MHRLLFAIPLACLGLAALVGATANSVADSFARSLAAFLLYLLGHAFGVITAVKGASYLRRHGRSLRFHWISHATVAALYASPWVALGWEVLLRERVYIAYDLDIRADGLNLNEARVEVTGELGTSSQKLGSRSDLTGSLSKLVSGQGWKHIIILQPSGREGASDSIFFVQFPRDVAVGHVSGWIYPSRHGELGAEYEFVHRARMPPPPETADRSVSIRYTIRKIERKRGS